MRSIAVISSRKSAFSSEFEGSFFGFAVTVRLTPQLVSIFDGDELVAEHSRMHGFKYRYCTDPAHTPDKSRGSELITSADDGT